MPIAAAMAYVASDGAEMAGKGGLLNGGKPSQHGDTAGTL